MAQTSTGEPLVDIVGSLKKGEIRLNCDTACSGKWGGAKKTLKGLYENKLWSDLTIQVASIGFKSDLSYYFLGSAAEGFGYPDAAQTYYKLASATPYKCNGLLNNERATGYIPRCNV